MTVKDWKSEHIIYIYVVQSLLSLPDSKLILEPREASNEILAKLALCTKN